MPSHYNKKPRNHPNGAGISRQSKIPKIPKTGRIGAVGAVLKKIGDILGGSKARRLDGRRKADKGIEYRAGSNGHEPIERTPGGWVQGKRFRKDRRRGSKFNIEKRKAKDLGKLALKITPPTVAAATAAGVYNRKNKDKNNGKVEEEPDYTKGGTLKLRELTPEEIKDRFHTNTERIKKSQKTSIPQSTYAKGMKRVKDQKGKALIQASEDRRMSKYPLSVRSAKGTKYSVGPKLTKTQKEAYEKKSTEGYKKVDAYNKFIKADKKFR